MGLSTSRSTSKSESCLVGSRYDFSVLQQYVAAERVLLAVRLSQAITYGNPLSCTA